ncbi:uncharacterized protein MONOS_18558 [Monocercomonoides exilis]|uniref:uncharacterized protein n=1 Tax=Monocercomonoides exilis TaxID=2049356 RepID=UPI00355A8A56|nr:hypothetical protein MONOS_18558 [Monocercomonoides exilis]
MLSESGSETETEKEKKKEKEKEKKREKEREIDFDEIIIINENYKSLTNSEMRTKNRTNQNNGEDLFFSIFSISTCCAWFMKFFKLHQIIVFQKTLVTNEGQLKFIQFSIHSFFFVVSLKKNFTH